MDNSLIDFFLNENVSISTGNFVQHLLVTLVLSLLVKIVYTRFSTTISNKKEFSKNFVILAQGLPVGGEIENLDDGTLISAFKNRKSFKK